MALAIELEEEYRLHEPQVPVTETLEETWLKKFPKAWAETGGLGEAKRVPPSSLT